MVRNDSSSPQTDGEKVNREPSPAPTPAEVCDLLDSSTLTGVGERVCDRDIINPPPPKEEVKVVDSSPLQSTVQDSVDDMEVSVTFPQFYPIGLLIAPWCS